MIGGHMKDIEKSDTDLYQIADTSISKQVKL